MTNNRITHLPVLTSRSVGRMFLSTAKAVKEKAVDVDGVSIKTLRGKSPRQVGRIMADKGYTMCLSGTFYYAKPEEKDYYETYKKENTQFQIIYKLDSWENPIKQARVTKVENF